MAEKRILKEEYAFYTGQADDSFAPTFAGISFPDPSYEIFRQVGDCFVFEYVISGKGTVIQDKRSFLVEEGDVYILEMGKQHHYYADPKKPFQKIWLNIKGSLVRHLLSDYGLTDVVKISGFHDPSWMFSIMDTIKKEPVHCRNELALLLHQYVIALSEFLGNRTMEQSPALMMKNYIEQNLAVPISIDDIAASVHLSRSRCIHLFKEVYQITPYNYYISQRLELAQNMLRNTGLPIQQIAVRLGFSDCHRFSAFFKKYCGQSPTKYRRGNLDKSDRAGFPRGEAADSKAF